MHLTPLFISLKGRDVLVIGGGKVANRKVRLLIRSGAKVQLVAPELHPSLQGAIDNKQIQYRQGRFEEHDISAQFLIIAATDDRAINKQVAKIAAEKNILVNVADAPELCTFMLSSTLDREPLRIAISSAGNSPTLVRQLRAQLESSVPSNYGELAKFIDAHRPILKQRIPDIEKRRSFWTQVIEGNVSELVLSGHLREAEKAIETLIKDFQNHKQALGDVYLVGAGPGDPDLLTFKALRLMQKADVIVYDRLVAPKILELCRVDAEMIYVGKQRDNHSVPQDAINNMLVELAQTGKNVCRLKGGDPFVFGRGGEEIDQLSQAGINFQIVPGISAANGCAAYAGIPLTHRDYAHSVLFIAGHQTNNTIDWEKACSPETTLVIYMGLGNLANIIENLVQHKLAKDTPVAVVEQGTTNNQRVHTATLTNLLKTVKCANVAAPTIIIIGQVVRLHQQLSWYSPDTHDPSSVFSSGSEEK